SDPVANLRASLAWYNKLVALGFRPLLEDSNGKGGYHLLPIFTAPISAPLAYEFSHWLTDDYAAHGLRRRPEVFPKQAFVSPRGSPGHFGNWLRLPGPHHKSDHWSRVWDGQQWLEGAAAAAHILTLTGDDPALIPPEVRAAADQHEAGKAAPLPRLP